MPFLSNERENLLSLDFLLVLFVASGNLAHEVVGLRAAEVTILADRVGEVLFVGFQHDAFMLYICFVENVENFQIHLYYFFNSCKDNEIVSDWPHSFGAKFASPFGSSVS